MGETCVSSYVLGTWLSTASIPSDFVCGNMERCPSALHPRDLCYSSASERRDGQPIALDRRCGGLADRRFRPRRVLARPISQANRSSQSPCRRVLAQVALAMVLGCATRRSSRSPTRWAAPGPCYLDLI